jgi:hypothetical protein
MSDESDSTNNLGCDSDGEDSVASSYESEVQDSRKRLRSADHKFKGTPEKRCENDPQW